MENTKLNCWEYLKCGREPKGAKAKEMGICPASVKTITNEMNGGKNGGRACWAVAGTFCGGTAQGSFAEKLDGCMNCSFHEIVISQEGSNYQGTIEILDKLKSL